MLRQGRPQLTGVVKYFNKDQQFGFIRRDDGKPDIYFNRQALLGDAGFNPSKGDKVIFEEGIGRRGPICVNVYDLSDPIAVEDHAQHEAYTTKAAEDLAETQARVQSYFQRRVRPTSSASK